MTRIYLDNAATSWPKPPAVHDSMDRYQRVLGVAAGRSAYREAMEVGRLVLDCRQRIANLVQLNDPRRIIFTSNGTDSLNLALHGLLQWGDHVITSVVEHNSTLRPLRWLHAKRGVDVTRVPCDGEGVADVDAIRRAIQKKTKLITLIHASNVTGAIQPVADVGKLAREHGVLFLVDAAQSLGHVPIDVSAISADLLAAPGHKGLLGPLGTGILAVATPIESQLEPVRQGGTGTNSESDEQPQTLPERYESGNHNVIGILGLREGVGYVRERGLSEIRQHEEVLTEQMLAGLHSIRGIRVYGPRDAGRRVGVVSFTIEGYDPQEVAALLDATYSIQVRAGLHCAPLMHEALRTAKLGGTIRLSIGPFTTSAEVDAAMTAVTEIAGG